MRPAFRIIGLAFLLLVLSACVEVQYSSVLQEPAVVEETIYQASNHGSGTGITSGGDLSFTSVDIPAKWAVVFRCQHGKFVIEGTGSRYRTLWEQLTRGDSVTIRYREKYEVRDNRGVKSRHLVDYDFLDAVKN